MSAPLRLPVRCTQTGSGAQAGQKGRFVGPLARLVSGQGIGRVGWRAEMGRCGGEPQVLDFSRPWSSNAPHRKGPGHHLALHPLIPCTRLQVFTGIHEWHLVEREGWPAHGARTLSRADRERRQRATVPTGLVAPLGFGNWSLDIRSGEVPLAFGNSPGRYPERGPAPATAAGIGGGQKLLTFNTTSPIYAGQVMRNLIIREQAVGGNSESTASRQMLSATTGASSLTGTSIGTDGSFLA